MGASVWRFALVGLGILLAITGAFAGLRTTSATPPERPAPQVSTEYQPGPPLQFLGEVQLPPGIAPSATTSIPHSSQPLTPDSASDRRLKANPGSAAPGQTEPQSPNASAPVLLNSFDG